MADAGKWIVTVGVKPERDLSPGAKKKLWALFNKAVEDRWSWTEAMRRWGK